MANVGKEQATIQKSVENQQKREANQLIKEENNRDHSVNRVDEDKATEKINDKSNNQQQDRPKGEKKETDEDPEETKKYFTDPNRGHNIDISG